MELLCIMHDGEPYGHLKIGKDPCSDLTISRIAGMELRTVRKGLAELEHWGVFSRTDDGVVYSRRMVRDEELRQVRAEGGGSSTRPAKKRGGHIGQLFNTMLERFQGCLACGTTLNLEVHRILPGRHGGKYEVGNVILLCTSDHRAISYGELSLETVLQRHGLRDLNGIFADTLEGNSAIPLRVSDPIPPSSASSSSSEQQQHPPTPRRSPPDGGSVAVVVASLANGHPNGNGKPSRGLPAVIDRGRQALADLVAMGEQDAETDRQRAAMTSLVFAYWAAKLRHATALQDPKRERIIAARLKENRHDVSELLFAVDGARRDRNLMGENERGRKYDGVETIFRDRGQVERLAALAGFRAGAVHPQLTALAESVA